MALGRSILLPKTKKGVFDNSSIASNPCMIDDGCYDSGYSEYSGCYIKIKVSGEMTYSSFVRLVLFWIQKIEWDRRHRRGRQFQRLQGNNLSKDDELVNGHPNRE